MLLAELALVVGHVCLLDRVHPCTTYSTLHIFCSIGTSSDKTKLGVGTRVRSFDIQIQYCMRKAKPESSVSEPRR
jgi:hypothetical protein